MARLSPPTLLRFSAIALLSVSALLTCYGPTELTVDVTGDLECSALRTRIYKGAPGKLDTFHEAETEPNHCTDGDRPGDVRIGTLVVVPSGDRNGKAMIEIVAGTNGVKPEDCLIGGVLKSECLVASRVFSFLEHTSRRLPIFLAKECLGRVCKVNETCIRVKGCVSNEVICTGDRCTVAGEDEVAVDSGPSDVTADVPVDASVAACTGPSNTDVLATPKITVLPTIVAGSPNFIYWFNPERTTATIERVHKRTGVIETVREFPEITAVGGSLAAEDDDQVVAGLYAPSAAAGKRYVWIESRGVDVIPYSENAAPPSIAVAVSPKVNKPNVFVGTSTDILTYDDAILNPFTQWQPSAKALLLGASSEHVARWSGTEYQVYPRTPSFLDAEAPTRTGSTFRLASMRDGIFASDELDGGAGQILRLAPPANRGVTVPFIKPAPISVAADVDDLWWTSGGEIERALHDGGSRAIAFQETGHRVANIVVDYPKSGCVYYWRRPEAGGALSIVVKPKPKL